MNSCQAAKVTEYENEEAGAIWNQQSIVGLEDEREQSNLRAKNWTREEGKGSKINTRIETESATRSICKCMYPEML